MNHRVLCDQGCAVNRSAIEKPRQQPCQIVKDRISLADNICYQILSKS